MTAQLELRNTGITADSPTVTGRRSVRIAILAAIVAAVAGGLIATQGDSGMTSSDVPPVGASAVPAVASVVAPEGYWNAYLNEWVQLGAAETTAPTGYWNAYLNEWVHLGAAETTAPTGYWNAYLNEWVQLGAIETTAPTGYWNAYLNEWVHLGG